MQSFLPLDSGRSVLARSRMARSIFILQPRQNSTLLLRTGRTRDGTIAFSLVIFAVYYWKTTVGHMEMKGRRPEAAMVKAAEGH